MSSRHAGSGGGLIRVCRADEGARIHFIVNDAAAAYRGVIPDDQWHEPYMTEQALEAEIAAGVQLVVEQVLTAMMRSCTGEHRALHRGSGCDPAAADHDLRC